MNDLWLTVVDVTGLYPVGWLVLLALGLFLMGLLVLLEED